MAEIEPYHQVSAPAPAQPGALLAVPAVPGARTRVRTPTRHRALVALVVVLGVLGCCGGVVGGGAFWWVGHQVNKASQGGANPSAGMYGLMLAWDFDEDIGLGRWVAPGQLGKIVKQHREWYAGRRSDPAFAQGWGVQLSHHATPAERTTMHGSDRATVVQTYRASWTLPPDMRDLGTTYATGEPHEWRAEVVKTGQGWKVQRVTEAPPWCGKYSRCGREPEPSGSPTPSPSPS